MPDDVEPQSTTPAAVGEPCPECGDDIGWDENGGLCDGCAEDPELLAEYTGGE